MPYEIRPVDGGEKVFNTETGHAASSKPQSHEMAVKQLRLLEMIRDGEKPDKDA